MTEADNPALPWRELMEFGLGELALSPNQFWAMTLKEISAAINGKRQLRFGGTGGAPSGAELAELIAAFPDTDTKGPSNGER